MNFHNLFTLIPQLLSFHCIFFFSSLCFPTLHICYIHTVFFFSLNHLRQLIHCGHEALTSKYFSVHFLKTRTCSYRTLTQASKLEHRYIKLWVHTNSSNPKLQSSLWASHFPCLQLPPPKERSLLSPFSFISLFAQQHWITLNLAGCCLVSPWPWLCRFLGRWRINLFLNIVI